jgi:hypothetical protein
MLSSFIGIKNNPGEDLYYKFVWNDIMELELFHKSQKLVYISYVNGESASEDAVEAFMPAFWH